MDNIYLIDLIMKIGSINPFLDFTIRILVIIILIIGIWKLISKKQLVD
jgi:hypothetical protein